MHGFMPVCHPDSLMPRQESQHFCRIATGFVWRRAQVFMPGRAPGTSRRETGDGGSANPKAGSGREHAKKGQKPLHCVPQGALYCREMTPFYFMFLIHISGAGN
jgi:hypothetical protein